MPPISTHTHASARAADEASAAAPRGPGTAAGAVRASAEPAGGPSGGADRLTGHEQRILAFEARWWRASGAKTQAIADELEMTPEQYYQQLARLIDHPGAAAEQPAVVRRLRAARDHRKNAR